MTRGVTGEKSTGASIFFMVRQLPTIVAWAVSWEGRLHMAVRRDPFHPGQFPFRAFWQISFEAGVRLCPWIHVKAHAVLNPDMVGVIAEILLRVTRLLRRGRFRTHT